MLDTRYILSYKVLMTSTGLLHIGDDKGEILLDEYSRKPVIPATGISGAIRNFLFHNINDVEKLDQLFGNASDGTKSKLFIQDTVTENEYDGKIEKRSRVKINAALGSAMDKGKFNIKALPSGMKFTVSMKIEAKDEVEKDCFASLINQSIKAIDLKVIRFGAQKTNGAGEFKINKVEQYILDLYDIVQYKKYLIETMEYNDVTRSISETKFPQNVMCIDVSALTDTPFLVSGNERGERDDADRIPLKNMAGEYIVPGSSLKGVLRNQCNKIVEFLGIDSSIVIELFGHSHDIKNDEEFRQGSVFVSDSVVENETSKVIYNRIKIDKFTGGTMMGAKFNERPVVGRLKFQILVQKLSDKNRDVAIGVLLFAIRDIIEGRATIGSGFNVGYGHFKMEKLDIMDGETRILVDSEKENINKYINAVKAYKGGFGA